MDNSWLYRLIGMTAKWANEIMHQRLLIWTDILFFYRENILTCQPWKEA